MLIERGMAVQGTDGDLGTVAEIVADEGADVFRGIVIASGLFRLKHVFLPGDKILRVEHNTVYVSLSKTDAEQLPAPSAGGQIYEGRDLDQ